MKNKGIEYMENILKEHEEMYSGLSNKLKNLSDQINSLGDENFYLDETVHSLSKSVDEWVLLKKKSDMYSNFVHAINSYCMAPSSTEHLFEKSTELYEKDSELAEKMISQRKTLGKKFPEKFTEFLKDHPDFLE